MASFGSALRRTREEKGISLDDIAGETRLSKRYLLALEDEAIHKLPGGTYNRAYLRTYAGYLGLDTEGLVRQYSLEEAHQTETGRLQPQPDVLTSIGKAVESRQTTARGGRTSNWNRGPGILDLLANWKWTAARPGRIGVLAGLGSLAVLLLAVGLWLGLRNVGRGADLATLPVSDDRGSSNGPPRADRVVTPPPEEAAETSRTVDPPPGAPAPGPSNAVPAPVPVAPVPSPAAPAATAPQPVAPQSDKAPVAADPPATAAAPAAAATAAAAAAAKTRTPARATAGRRLSVTGSGVGTDVVDKRLVGESDTFTVGTRVTFWTRIAGGKAGDTISHVWFHDGVRIGTISLRVGSADWRTQSRQLLTPDGEWAVEARDADGRVLVRHAFHTAPK